MTAIERLAAIMDCQQAIQRFYLALDSSDFDAVAACMASQGVWHRQGAALCGPAQVRAALAKRPAGRTTAHMVQNLVIDIVDPGLAQARYLTLVYRHDAPAPPSGPVPLGTPLSISIHEERLVRTPAGDWLVQEKQSRRKFGD
ncbi:nuclear transport factor 2 family protein [Candidimonas humi]|uniref:Nuclear transport factor 2 family protein n=1 Tax=Candidimonas humi TaxID=683355 RepID=A0ABV8NXI1_9BURK|nr:nuclear transport factor 2 family protein [Candidimonas humi]MBV6304869.1 nuclear transport factor 2 family protein [Candidimonas humi]